MIGSAPVSQPRSEASGGDAGWSKRPDRGADRPPKITRCQTYGRAGIACSAVHGALQHLEAVNLALDRVVAPAPCHRRAHRLVIGPKKPKLLRFMREAVQRRLSVEASELLIPPPPIFSFGG